MQFNVLIKIKNQLFKKKFEIYGNDWILSCKNYKKNMYNIFLIYSKMLYIQKHRSDIEAKEKQEHEDFLLKNFSHEFISYLCLQMIFLQVNRNQVSKY